MYFEDLWLPVKAKGPDGISLSRGEVLSHAKEADTGAPSSDCLVPARNAACAIITQGVP